MSAADLSGKVALVTGASSGLGAHFAGTLGRAGACVAMIARSEGKLAASVDDLRAEGIDAQGFVADVTDRAALEVAIEAVERDLGPIDILVNNAGIARTNRFLEMSEEDWATVIDVDLTGVWRTAQLVAARMVAGNRPGTIINIASILGFLTQSTQANYGSAKAGVLHLTKLMARELGRHDIRVNAIAPGYFATEINADFFASDAGQAYISKLFPRRLGDPAELDGALMLLASDAGSFITGTTLTVDGGTHLAAA
jgi:NAD(P)-dependent dehydrogenase (short-subunit alcohol dehydrogenase family)